MRPLSTRTRNYFLSLLIGCSVIAASSPAASAASCPSCGPSGVSALSVLSGALLVEGSTEGIKASGTLLVVSVEKLADGVVIVCKGASDGASYTLKLSGKALGNVSVAAGNVVEVTALSAGTMLVVSGQAIAFIPNEIGRSLVHHTVAK